MLPFLLVLIPLLCIAALLANNAPSLTKLDYPKAKRVDQVDDYHGTKVADPIGGWKTPTHPTRSPGCRRRIS
jgi:hypothetical protein